eukprot:TRINITY_DN4475_c0_g1_i1.p1 TRINITY_DN4475_c0_g1~~TRINITY_DN4475_c0_g1_i1.p1  ORF type:complete len:1074 (-),score=287.07 TRINITY_DN4475_c0_g1_i1:122-3343(-)
MVKILDPLRKGQLFGKKVKFGVTKKRLVWLTDDDKFIRWSAVGENTFRGELAICDLQHVVTKGSSGISLIGRNRNLDLSCKNKNEQGSWVLIFKELLPVTDIPEEKLEEKLHPTARRLLLRQLIQGVWFKKYKKKVVKRRFFYVSSFLDQLLWSAKSEPSISGMSKRSVHFSTILDIQKGKNSEFPASANEDRCIVVYLGHRTLNLEAEDDDTFQWWRDGLRYVLRMNQSGWSNGEKEQFYWWWCSQNVQVDTRPCDHKCFAPKINFDDFDYGNLLPNIKATKANNNNRKDSNISNSSYFGVSECDSDSDDQTCTTSSDLISNSPDSVCPIIMPSPRTPAATKKKKKLPERPVNYAELNQVLYTSSELMPGRRSLRHRPLSIFANGQSLTNRRLSLPQNKRSSSQSNIQPPMLSSANKLSNRNRNRGSTTIGATSCVGAIGSGTRRPSQSMALPQSTLGLLLKHEQAKMEKELQDKENKEPISPITPPAPDLPPRPTGNSPSRNRTSILNLTAEDSWGTSSTRPRKTSLTGPSPISPPQNVITSSETLKRTFSLNNLPDQDLSSLQKRVSMQLNEKPDFTSIEASKLADPDDAEEISESDTSSEADTQLSYSPPPSQTSALSAEPMEFPPQITGHIENEDKNLNHEDDSNSISNLESLEHSAASSPNTDILPSSTANIEFPDNNRASMKSSRFDDPLYTASVIEEECSDRGSVVARPTSMALTISSGGGAHLDSIIEDDDDDHTLTSNNESGSALDSPLTPSNPVETAQQQHQKQKLSDDLSPLKIEQLGDDIGINIMELSEDHNNEDPDVEADDEESYPPQTLTSQTSSLLSDNIPASTSTADQPCPSPVVVKHNGVVVNEILKTLSLDNDGYCNNEEEKDSIRSAVESGTEMDISEIETPSKLPSNCPPVLLKTLKLLDQLESKSGAFVPIQAEASNVGTRSPSLRAARSHCVGLETFIFSRLSKSSEMLGAIQNVLQLCRTVLGVRRRTANLLQESIDEFRNGDMSPKQVDDIEKAVQLEIEDGLSQIGLQIILTQPLQHIETLHECLVLFREKMIIRRRRSQASVNLTV